MLAQYCSVCAGCSLLTLFLTMLCAVCIITTALRFFSLIHNLCMYVQISLAGNVAVQISLAGNVATIACM